MGKSSSAGQNTSQLEAAHACITTSKRFPCEMSDYTDFRSRAFTVSLIKALLSL